MDDKIKELIAERDQVNLKMAQATDLAQAAYDHYVELSAERNEISDQYFALCDEINRLMNEQLEIQRAASRPVQGIDS